MGASIYDLDTTPANNTSVDGISQAENVMRPPAVNNAFRALDAILARFCDDLGAVNTVGGTADAITVTLSSGITAYATGQIFRFVAASSNTGAATINVNGIGAKAIRKISGGTDAALAAGELAAGETYLVVYRASANSAAGAWVLVGAGGGGLSRPQGRLTLTSGMPVLVSDVTAATTVYYTPREGDSVPIYNGAAFQMKTFAELTLALDSDSGHSGYHQSGKNFDLFVINDAATLRLATGPAWSSDTARGTGAGTTELERKNGILTNKVSITARFGAASGDTITVAANQGTYVGTMRCSADGQTQVKFGGIAASGDEAWFGIWNAWNRVTARGSVGDSTNNWNLAATSTRPANGSATMRVSAVRGGDEDPFSGTYQCLAVQGSGGQASVGVGYDSTSAFSGEIAFTSSGQQNLRAGHTGYGLGFHYVQALECSAVGGTAAFSGDAGGPDRVQNGLGYDLRY